MDEGLESIKDFYLFANERRKIFCYVYNKENTTRTIKFGSDVDKTKGDILIDVKSSRLFALKIINPRSTQN